MNFAGVYKVPCVLICQNNHWAISVPTSRQTASPTLAVKGRAYGVPSVRVDGNDVLAMHHAVSEALARARAGGGPTFIEAVTYRIGAHSTSDDPTRYRSQEEVDRWMQRDPLLRLRRHLVARGALDDAADAALEEALNGEIAAAIAEVEALGPPARETLFDDVYAELPWHLREQRADLLRCPPAPAHGGGR
jgi:pyruvate dehydrogenase E1 component alpha subunit/2-oxoisovalerate dehydrogenase E1 component alpha subunit